MGSKRPDQYHTDPRAAGAADNQDRGDHPAIKEEDKQRLAEQRAEERREAKIPEHHENPALARERERKRKARKRGAGGSGAGSRRGRGRGPNT